LVYREEQNSKSKSSDIKNKKSHVSQNFMHQHKVMHSFLNEKVKPAKN